MSYFYESFIGKEITLKFCLKNKGVAKFRFNLQMKNFEN